MRRRTTWIIGGVAALAVAGASTGVAVAVSDDDGTEQPITGDALEQASEAALEHTGGGEVTDTEVGDEEGYYEVEVTLPDGGEVDVHLDEDFTVIGDEPEDEPDDD
ncbi:PepSY domain-containing protein [Aquipuribacter nitratireducens]|uniref:PepSY domain-containing protein n=1 Tax=Aquipuribacter nitratireducens TaxID=650104 RepID=A0ABW0GPL7_9MICO